jgi:quinolinate synthase
MSASRGIAAGKVAIVAHHYQRPEIVARASLVGDSYRLAVEAARTDAEFIVLCGVRFMAESAAILARAGQTVLIPDMDAGCPMADMIDRGAEEDSLARIAALSGKDAVPVAYMNSHADLKALVGERGGSVCTSGNARKILAHYLDAGKPVYFTPDFNLGMNTARELGIAPEAIRRVGRDLSITRVDGDPNGSARDEDDLSAAKLFLWDGFCHVHRAFTEDDVRRSRARMVDATVVVHPECAPEVTALADRAGSTEAMRAWLADAAPGSRWVVGTEGRFVERMAAEFPDRTILPLRASYCHNMNRIDLPSLERTLARIAEVGSLLEGGGKDAKAMPGAVFVRAEEREAAAKALRAMVEITEAKSE